MAGGAEKTSIIRIMQILEKYSDEKHPLQQQEILSYLEKDYGLQMERKAVSNNVQQLVELFSDEESPVRVVTKRKVGTYLEERLFSDEEIRFLIDATMGNYSLDATTREDIYTKLLSLASASFREGEKEFPNMNVQDPHDTDFRDAFYDNDMDEVIVIRRAIKEKKTVTFTFSVQGRGTLEFEWTPLCTTIRKKRYYALFITDYRNLIWARVDYLSKVRIGKKEGAKMDLAELVQKVPKMPSGDPPIDDEKDTFVFATDKNYLSKEEIIQMLGTDIQFQEPDRNGRFIFSVSCSYDTVDAFLNEYRRGVFVIRPFDLRKEEIHRNGGCRYLANWAKRRFPDTLDEE